jgi:hypothetical protein
MKRGGHTLALDFDAADAELARIASSSPDPEVLLHQEWIRCLFTECVEQLRKEFLESGREKQFRIFEAFDLEDGVSRPTYRELGTTLGITEITVTNHLAAARRRFRAIVLETLREMTASDAEFRSEARALLGVDP